MPKRKRNRAADRERIAELQRLVLALADKLATVANHLAVLSERKECRNQRTGEHNGHPH